jgi:hypothetical protein
MSVDLPRAKLRGSSWRAYARALWAYYEIEVIATAGVALCMAVMVALVLSSCTLAKEAGGEVGGTVGELIACPLDLFDCGEVRLFTAPADNDLGRIELCIDADDHPEDIDAAELVYGPSEPTPRHQGLCRFCCGDDCGRGGNAFSGTWCMGHE